MDRAQKDKFPGSLVFFEPSVEGAGGIVIGSKISGVVVLIMHIMICAGQVNIGVVGVPAGGNPLAVKGAEMLRFQVPETTRLSGVPGPMIAAMLPQLCMRVTTDNAAYSW